MDESSPNLASAHESPEELADRRRWRICCWLLFLLTPAATMLVGSGRNWLQGILPDVLLRAIGPGLFGLRGAVVVGVLGAMAAGFCLVRLHTQPRTTFGVIVRTIAFGIGILIVYMAIAFVGCLVVISKAV